jgi:hypothetical protein
MRPSARGEVPGLFRTEAMMRRVILGMFPGYSVEQIEDLADYISERIDERMDMDVFVGIDDSQEEPFSWQSTEPNADAEGRLAFEIVRELIEDWEVGRS